MEQIEVTFQLIDRQYTFATLDRKIWFGHRDREKCAARFIRLVTELARKGTFFRIGAYAPLGPALKQLRDAGAICRVGLQNPPPLKPIKWQMPGKVARVTLRLYNLRSPGRDYILYLVPLDGNRPRRITSHYDKFFQVFVQSSWEV